MWHCVRGTLSQTEKGGKLAASLGGSDRGAWMCVGGRLVITNTNKVIALSLLDTLALHVLLLLVSIQFYPLII